MENVSSAVAQLGNGVSFPARPVCVRFVVGKVALRRVSLQVIFFSHVSNNPPAFPYAFRYTVCLQMNGAVSKVNKEYISHLTLAQRTPSATATLQVSRALPAVRFSCLLRGQFPRWRRSRKRLSVNF